MPEQSTSFNTWAIVEVMGHKRFAGYVTEQTFGVATLIRVDVPETEQRATGWQDATSPLPTRTTPAYSKLIGVGSIYCITPCTEEVARKCAVEIEKYNDPIPVALPVARQIPASVGPDGVEDAQYETSDDHEDVEDDRPF